MPSTRVGNSRRLSSIVASLAWFVADGEPCVVVCGAKVSLGQSGTVRATCTSCGAGSSTGAQALQVGELASFGTLHPLFTTTMLEYL